jgi:hypothetical protein
MLSFFCLSSVFVSGTLSKLTRNNNNKNNNNNHNNNTRANTILQQPQPPPQANNNTVPIDERTFGIQLQ